jgi:hypothetical protein
MTPERPRLPWRLAAAYVVLALLGVARSAVRHQEWADSYGLWVRTRAHVPLSYKPYHALAQQLRTMGYEAESLRAFHMAITLHPRPYQLQHELADHFRDRGECRAALYWYRESLRVEPDQPVARLSRIEGLMALGREQEAREEAAVARSYIERGDRSSPP